MKKIFFVPLLALLFSNAFSQTWPGTSPINLDSLHNTINIEQNTLLFVDSVGQLDIAQVPSQKLTTLATFRYRNKLPSRLAAKPAYLLFTIQNLSATPRQVYLYPGMLYDNLLLYKRSASGTLELQPGTKSNRRSGFVYITIPPAHTESYILKLDFAKTEFVRIKSMLVDPLYLENFKMDLTDSYRDNRIASYVLCGVLLMMILFALVNYYLNRKIEFVYYSLFSICMFLLIFFSSYLSKRPGLNTALFRGYFDLILLIVGTIFYLVFIRKFLDTKHKHVLLDKLFKIEAWVLMALMLVFTYVYFQTDDVILGKIIENAMKILAMIIGGVFIVMGLKHKDKLIKYLAIGSAAQIFFSIISLVIILMDQGSPSIFRSALFYFEMGIIMVVFFFLLGLAYKNRRDLIEKTQEQEAMKLEVEKKVFETQLAVIKAQQEERNRISADMHDDLGAGMTTIRLFSELAKAKMGETVIPEIEKISTSADELLNKMNAIIWSMSSSNDTLGNMVAYIRSYALEYFDNTGIECKITIPERLPELEVSGEIRRNIFLVVKEALNNIVKHSGATQVRITMQKEIDGLSLLIHDNGKGINMDDIRQFGNGLKNMKKRMDDIAIEFSIENDHGTVIKLYRKTRD